jgi:anti-sigma B factor antagonist
MDDQLYSSDNADAFSVTVLRSEPALELRISGELDLAAEPAIIGALIQAMADNADLTMVDVDVSGVEFIDSYGVRALLRCRDVAATRGREIQLRDVNGPVARLLELVGVDDRLLPHR